MKNIKNWESFTNRILEKNDIGINEVQKEVKKILSEMFAWAKNINFLGKNLNEPDFVEFEVDAKDFDVDYTESMKMEYSEGVLKKRKFEVSIKFHSKSKEGTSERPIYKMKFKIKLNPTSEINFDENEEELAWSFEDKPTKVINFIKSDKQSCEWDSSNNRLYITKKAYKKMATDQLRTLIEEEGGQKIRLK